MPRFRVRYIGNAVQFRNTARKILRRSEDEEPFCPGEPFEWDAEVLPDGRTCAIRSDHPPPHLPRAVRKDDASPTIILKRGTNLAVEVHLEQRRAAQIFQK